MRYAIILLNDDHHQRNEASRTECDAKGDGFKIRKCATSDDAQVKAEHKAIAVVEPVGRLKAVHNQVGNVERHNCNQKEDEYARHDLLAHGILFGKEIGGDKEERQHSAVQKGKSLGANGIVGSGQEFVQQIENIKVGRPFPCGFRKGGFSKIQCVISAKDYNGGHCNCKNRIKENAQKRFNKMEAFVDGIVAVILRVCKVVNKEVDKAIKANHVPDIEVAENGQRQEYRIHLEFAVLDEFFHSEGEERKPHQGINPHGIMLLNNGICREGIEDGKGLILFLSTIAISKQ